MDMESNWLQEGGREGSREVREREHGREGRRVKCEREHGREEGELGSVRECGREGRMAKGKECGEDYQ